MTLLTRSVVVVGCLAWLAATPAADGPTRFSPWSTPVNLGPVVNSPNYEGCPNVVTR